MSRRAIVLAAGLVALLAAPASAQSRRRVLGGAEFYSVSFGTTADTAFTKSVSVVTLPFGLVWSPSSRLTVDVGSRIASVTHTMQNGRSASLSGLTDTQVRAVYAIRPDQVVFSLAVNLPTGKTTLSNDELVVAGRIASDLIPYPVSSFGSGSNVTTGLAVAVPVGGWALGIGGSYRLSGSFQLLSGQPSSYKPGGEMRLRVGADRLIGQGRVSFGVTYSSFAVDEVGSASYQPGNRMITQASYGFPIGNMSLSLYAWDIYRAGGELTGGVPTDKQNLLTLGAAATLQMGRNQLRPSVEFRKHSASDEAHAISSLEASGTLLSLGLRYQMAVGDRLQLLPSVRFDTGNTLTEIGGTQVAYTGINAGIALRANW